MAATAVLTEPTKEQFSRQVNEQFRVRSTSGAEFEMSLIEFHDVLDSATQETFSLLFRAPAEVEPEQGIHTVSNAGIGEQEIFLVPVNKDENGVYFEAIYNRFKK